MSSWNRRATEPRPRGRPGQRGQSVVELALAIPVLVLLLVSVFNITVLISNRLVAGYATRQGARLAAQLGNGQGSMTTDQVDQQICQSVLASTTNLTFGSITEIDIYNPSAADGSYKATDPHDSYNGTCGLISAQGYKVSSRDVAPPNEDSIGVRVQWTYTPPTGGYSFTLSGLEEYTVMKAAPVLQ